MLLRSTFPHYLLPGVLNIALELRLCYQHRKLARNRQEVTRSLSPQLFPVERHFTQLPASDVAGSCFHAIHPASIGSLRFPQKPAIPPCGKRCVVYDPMRLLHLLVSRKSPQL
jgi:hypothetical protein